MSMNGPGIFIAQFLRDEAPFDQLDTLAGWAAEKGYIGLQIPSWDSRAIELKLAAESQDYCDEYRGKLAEKGLHVTELTAHLQGQVLAIHPAYEPSVALAAGCTRTCLSAMKCIASS